jgi:hypothetical protein
MSETEELSITSGVSEDFSEIIRVLGSHAFFSMLHQEQEGEPSVEAQCQLYKELYAMFDEFIKAKESEYYEDEEESREDVIVLTESETEVDYGNCAECGVALSMEYIVEKFISLPEEQWFCQNCQK